MSTQVSIFENKTVTEVIRLTQASKECLLKHARNLVSKREEITIDKMFDLVKNEQAFEWLMVNKASMRNIIKNILNQNVQPYGSFDEKKINHNPDTPFAYTPEPFKKVIT